MSVLSNTGIRAGASGAGGGAETGVVTNSLRFVPGDSTLLQGTPSGTGNRKTFTYSCWMKGPGFSGTVQMSLLLAAYQPVGGSNNRYFQYGFTGDSLRVACYWYYFVMATPVFRDPTSWMHLVLAVDTTISANADHRMRIYVNGSEITFSTRSNPSLSMDLAPTAPGLHNIGTSGGSGQPVEGYLSHIHMVDGLQLDPTSFAETDATTGQWVPIEYTGSYGNNGFHLKFDNISDLGEDSSGNDIDFTPNNFTVASNEVTVAAATGGLPFYNTTDDYGETKGSGYRTDSSAGTTDGTGLVLALPGDVLTDEHDEVNTGSSANTVTVNGDVATSTSESKFYGTSLYFDGTGDYLNTSANSDFDFGTGDFTIEGWFYTTNTGTATIYQNGTEIYWTPNVEIQHRSTGYMWYSVVKSGANSDQGGAGSIKFNDSGWNHYAMSKSGTTVKCFLNGQLDKTITGIDAAVSSATSADHRPNIGCRTNGSLTTLTNYFDGYIQDLRVYKGVAKYSSAFTVPTIQTNAADIDYFVDSPSTYDDGGNGVGNYCTLNPLDKSSQTNIALTNGYLDAANTTSSGQGRVDGTIAFSSGKWYFEGTVTGSSSYHEIGIIKTDEALANGIGYYSGGYSYNSAGSKYNNNATVAYGDTYTAGDVIGVAIDLDNGDLYFYKNGVVQNSGTAAFTGLSGEFTFTVGTYASYSNFGWSSNFGARSFKHTPPTGYKALNTFNLDDTTILSGTYEGNGAADGPVVWMNATPATLKIGTSNPPTSLVTFSPTTVDPLAGGFKIRNSSTNNGSGTTYYWLATTNRAFKYANAQTNE